MKFTQSPTSLTVPIEDMQEGKTILVNVRQLLPTKIDFTTQDVYDWAHIGLSQRLIAAKVMLNENTIASHFSKTIAKAKADRAIDLYCLVSEDIIEQPGRDAPKPNIDSAWKMLNRLDPLPKDPTVVISQTFHQATELASSISMEDINSALLEE